MAYDERERSVDQIADDIARTREEIDDTLDALARKLTPGALVDQAFSYFRSGPGEFASNLGRTVKANPLPVTLLGIGLGWLMVGERPREAGDWSAAEGEGEGGARTALRRTGEAAERARAGVADVAARAAGAVRGMRGEGAGALERTRRQGARLGETAGSLLREQPLVLGAIGLAIGAALGTALPETGPERAALDEARERLGETAAAAVREGRDAVERAADASREAARGGARP
jgi:hypothetical protein